MPRIQPQPAQIGNIATRRRIHEMHEADLQTAALWIGGLVLSALGILFKREVKRVDDYGERLDEIERTVPGLVKHSDLARTEATIIDAIRDVKTEVRSERERINRITEHRQ